MTEPRETESREREPRETVRRTASGPRRRLRRALAPFIGPAVVVVVYALVRMMYLELADSDGMLTPAGSVDGALAALALATFLLRMLTLIVVPFVVVYRVVDRLLARLLLGRSRPRERSEE